MIRYLLGSWVLSMAFTQCWSYARADNVVSDSAWYDSDTGSIVPVNVKPSVDDSLNRDSRWLPQAKKVKKPAATPAATTGGAGVAGNGWFGSGLTLSNLIGWGVLMLLLGLVIAAILLALSRAEVELSGGAGARRSDRADDPLDEQTIERMKHLPAELRRTDVNPRSEAELLMQEGHYDQAIIVLFGHQLLMLDRAAFLRLNRGKTNRKYIQESNALNAQSADALQRTVDAFERSYFGRHEISRTEFEVLWENNLSLEKIVDSAREVAA